MPTDGPSDPAPDTSLGRLTLTTPEFGQRFFLVVDGERVGEFTREWKEREGEFLVEPGLRRVKVESRRRVFVSNTMALEVEPGGTIPLEVLTSTAITEGMPNPVQMLLMDHQLVLHRLDNDPNRPTR